MKINVIADPVFALEIEDFFDKNTNKQILNEAMRLKSSFQDAVIGKGLDKNFRSNIVAYYDEIFATDRTKSVLLSQLDNRFRSDKLLREVLASCPYSICDFLMTNYHETQISRYGNNGEKYDWHIDRFDNLARHITLVYWFCENEDRITGGDLGLTNSPIYDGKPIDEQAEIKKIKFKNNKAIIFSSAVPHCVFPTKSPKQFRQGRFSVNCWIGFR